MYAEEIKRLRKLIRKDNQFKKVNKFFERVAEEQSASGLYKEIQNLHKMRSSRSLDRGSKAFLDKVVEANLQDQSYRSRLAEIQMECTRTLSKYEPVIEDLVLYLHAQYLENIKGFFSSKQDRLDFLQGLCKDHARFLREIRSVEDSAKIVITDIDKAGYMFKNLIEAVKIVHERKA